VAAVARALSAGDSDAAAAASARSATGHTRLCQALLQGVEVEALQLLMEAGASPNTAEPGCASMLHFFVANQKPRQVQQLLTLGCDWRLPDRQNGDAALASAIKAMAVNPVKDRSSTLGARLEVVRMLAQADGGACARYRHPRTASTALHEAASAGDARVVQLLLDLVPGIEVRGAGRGDEVRRGWQGWQLVFD